MARSELMAILGGRRLTEVVPPHAGEPTADYAVRATGLLMVRYLAQVESDTAPPVAGQTPKVL